MGYLKNFASLWLYWKVTQGFYFFSFSYLNDLDQLIQYLLIAETRLIIYLFESLEYKNPNMWTDTSHEKTTEMYFLDFNNTYSVLQIIFQSNIHTCCLKIQEPFFLSYYIELPMNSAPISFYFLACNVENICSFSLKGQFRFFIITSYLILQSFQKGFYGDNHCFSSLLSGSWLIWSLMFS